MKNKKPKNLFKLRKTAAITIQLYKDRHGFDNCSVTTTSNKKPWLKLNALGFGRYLAKNDLFDKFDKEFLEDIFFYFLRERHVLDCSVERKKCFCCDCVKRRLECEK